MMFSDLDIHRATDLFYDIINNGIAAHVPIKLFRDSNFPKYFSAELRSLIIDKKKAHKLYITSESQEDYLRFSNLRARCKELINRDYNLYLRATEDGISENPKNFWKFVNDQRKTYELPDCMHYNDKLASDGQSIANLFSEFFKTVYCNNNTTSVDYKLNNTIEVRLKPVTIAEIFDKIMGLSGKLGCGPDNVPEYMLVNLVYSITKPLYLLFNKSLDEGELPIVWKESYIVPIFKNGDKEDVQNYRSISKQSAIPKILDSLIYDQLSWSCKRFFIEEQHGFIAGKSTITNLVVYQSDLLDALEKNYQVDAIYTDFSRAFDRINHELLMARLRAIGFDERSVSWLKSMLIGRTQRVMIGSYKSDIIRVTSGVPQGGHCAPLFFNLFINDVAQCLNECSFALFADDLKLYRVIKGLDDCMILQDSLNKFLCWCDSNDLALNPNKCSSISFKKSRAKIQYVYSINGVSLSVVECIKDLGVLMDNELSFKEHYNCMIAKAFQMLGFIFRIGNEMSVNTLRVLYCSLVRPCLEYASTVWSPYYNNGAIDIEKVQHKFVNYCLYRDRLAGDNVIAANLNLRSLKFRRVVADLCFVYKLLNGLVDCPALLSRIKFKVPARNLRNCQLFCIDYHRTNYGIHSPLVRTLKALNGHPDLNPFGGSLSKFKKHVCDTFIDLLV